MSTKLVVFNDSHVNNTKTCDTILTIEILPFENNQVKSLFEFTWGPLMNSPLESNQLNKLSFRLMITQKPIMQNSCFSLINSIPLQSKYKKVCNLDTLLLQQNKSHMKMHTNIKCSGSNTLDNMDLINTQDNIINHFGSEEMSQEEFTSEVHHLKSLLKTSPITNKYELKSHMLKQIGLKLISKPQTRICLCSDTYGYCNKCGTKSLKIDPAYGAWLDVLLINEQKDEEEFAVAKEQYGYVLTLSNGLPIKPLFEFKVS